MEHILRENPDMYYVGVDLFEEQPDGLCETYSPGENGHDWDHESNYNTCREISEQYPNARIYKSRTDDEVLLSGYPNGWFDIVFIDADHSYEGVKSDIHLWLPKVKSGGILAGHDFNVEMFPGTVQAVCEAFPSSMVQLYDDTVWAVKVI